jgi:hypothetical protein
MTMLEETKDIRTQAREKANEALQAKIGWIVKWQASEVSRSILGRWDLGEEIDEVLQDKARGGRIFGKGAMSTIAMFMSEDPSVISMAHKLYKAYPDYKRLVEITEMRMQDEVTPLSYSHIRQLLAVKDPQRRHELMNKCLEACWTSAELGRAVQGLNGGKQTNNPNGRASTPKDAETVISQMISFADDFDSRNIRVWKDPRHSVSAQVDRLEPIQYTEELVKQLGVLAHRMRQLANEATARAEEAERKCDEVSRVLAMGTEAITPAVDLTDKQPDAADELRRKRGGRPAGRRVKVS